MQRIVSGIAALIAVSSALAQDEQRPVSKQVKAAAPTNVVPGRSFGRVKLGMTKDELVKILGKPNTEAVLDGDITESIWHGNARRAKGVRKQDFVAVYFYDHAVIQIDGSTSRFKTKSGLSTDSKWSEFAAKFPKTTARKRSYPLDEDQPRMLHFAMDAADAGFGWVQVAYEKPGIKAVETNPIDMMVIHRPGTRMLFGVVDFSTWNEPGRTDNSITPKVADPKPPKKEREKPIAKPDSREPRPTTQERSRAGETAPDFRGTTLNDHTFSLSQTLKTARAVVVNFWYVSNDASNKDLVRMQKLHDRWAAEGLIVVGVDLGDRFDLVKAHLANRQITYPNIIDENGEGPVSAYRILGFPTTVVIDSEGKIVDVINGLNEERVRRALEKVGFKD